MIACVDVDYGDDQVVTACLGFEAWTDAVACYETVTVSASPAAAYQPGQFYQRELPYLVAALRPLAGRLRLAIVDGYVWLGPERRGLGAHLAAALDPPVPVIGVAKSAFAGALAVAVVRGAGKRPLHVTATGIDVRIAAAHVQSMHGPHRHPTLLKRVDQLARRLVAPGPASADQRET